MGHPFSPHERINWRFGRTRPQKVDDRSRQYCYHHRRHQIPTLPSHLLHCLFGPRSVLYLRLFIFYKWPDAFYLSFFAAYLTNPSENSFRAYLTEQSFRQHLSCLDDCAEDDQDSISPLESSDSKPKATRNTVLNDNGSPFHFANRASISIRTPRHALHSFAIFTVAAIVTPAKTGKDSVERGNTSISDSWFIGAFGMWWRGGVLEAWYQDIVSRTGDEESWAAGVLGMKTLDRCDEFNGTFWSPYHS